MAGELYSSRDCPGMVCVSQESRDTQTRGGTGRRAVSIQGLSWDCMESRKILDVMCCTLSHVHVAVHMQGRASTWSQCIYMYMYIL